MILKILLLFSMLFIIDSGLNGLINIVPELLLFVLYILSMIEIISGYIGYKWLRGYLNGYIHA